MSSSVLSLRDRSSTATSSSSSSSPSSLVSSTSSSPDLLDPIWLNSIHVKAKAAVYFTVSTLFVFVILSNSLSRFLKTIWSDVGNNWAYAWAWLETWHFEPMTLYVAFGFGLHLVVFWIYVGIMSYFDFIPTPEQNPLSRWKMQPGKNEPVDPAKFRYAIFIALRNQFLVHLPMLFLTFPLVQWRGMSFTLPLPTFYEFFMDVSGALVVEEVMFYYSHRLFHHGYIYGYIHKFHHEWTAPVGVASIYAHPLEHLLSNLLPVFIGPFIMKSHLATMWVWQTVAALVAMNTHSGYHLPFMPSPEAHDYHHLKFNQNYGVLGILDYVHGTDAGFRSSKQFSRHRTLFSFDDAEFPRATVRVESETVNVPPTKDDVKQESKERKEMKLIERERKEEKDRDTLVM